MRRFCLTAALWILTLAVAGSLHAADDVLKSIPDDAIGFFYIKEIGTLNSKLFAASNQLKMPFPVLDFVKMQLGIQKGIDEKGGAAAVLLPPIGGEPHVVILLAVSDYKEFLQGLNPNGEQDGISTAKLGEEQGPTLVAQKGSLAILAPPNGKEDIRRVLDSKKDITAAVAPMASWLATTDAAIVATPGGLKQTATMAVDQLTMTRQMFAGNAGPEAQQALTAMDSVMTLFTFLRDEIGGGAIGFRIDASGAAHLGGRALFTSTGQMSAASKSMKSSAVNPLTGVPAGPYAVAFGLTVPEELAGAATALGEKLGKLPPGTDPAQAELSAKILKATLEMMKLNRGVAGAIAPPEGDGPVLRGLRLVNHVVDAEQAMAKYGEVTKLMEEFAKSGAAAGGVFNVAETSVGSLKGVTVEATFDVAKLGIPPEAQPLVGLLVEGGKIVTHTAPVGKTEMGTAYFNQDNLLKIAESVANPGQSLANDPEIAKTNALLPQGAQAVGYIHPAGLIPVVQVVLKATGMPTPLPPFPATPPIGGAIKFSDGGVEGDLVVPTEVLTAAGDFLRSFGGP